jgi:hypothetical protein
MIKILEKESVDQLTALETEKSVVNLFMAKERERRERKRQRKLQQVLCNTNSTITL